MNCFICSPYGGKPENVDKARRYMRYAAAMGYVPFAPHVMLHGVLDDKKPEERRRGRGLGEDVLVNCCEAMLVCGPHLTAGMLAELNLATHHQITVATITDDELEAWEAGQQQQ